MPMATDLTQCDKKGTEMSIYYDTADDPTTAGGSSCTTPTWVFNKAVTGDVTITETEDEEELSGRDPALIYKQYTESKADLEVSGELVVDNLYEGYIYMNAMRSGSFARNLLVLDGYLSELNNVGFKGKWRNFERTKSGPETGAMKQNFKLKPAACVKTGCYITPVKTAASSAIATYDPGVFAAYDVGDSPEQQQVKLATAILMSSTYRGMTNTEAEEVFTDVGPFLSWIGADETDKLLTCLVESSRIPPEANVRSARRFNEKAVGLGGFNREAAVKVLNEIIGNALGEDKIRKPK